MISVFGREVRGFILRGIQQKYHAVRSCWPAQRDSEGFPPTLITSTQPALLRYSQLSYSTAQLLFQNLNLLPHLWATLPHHHPQVTGKLDFFSCDICVALWPQDDATSILTDILMPCKFQLTSWSTGGWLSVHQNPASCALEKYPIDNALGSHLLAFRN